jgi:hypothetical protein
MEQHCKVDSNGSKEEHGNDPAVSIWPGFYLLVTDFSRINMHDRINERIKLFFFKICQWQR